jgi:hypothetical protein
MLDRNAALGIVLPLRATLSRSYGNKTRWSPPPERLTLALGSSFSSMKIGRLDEPLPSHTLVRFYGGKDWKKTKHE